MGTRRSGYLTGLTVLLLAAMLFTLFPSGASQAQDTGGTWTGRAAMVQGRADLGVAAVNGKVYAIGGTRDHATGLTTVEEYDPASNSWTNCAALSASGCAPMPSARFALGVAAATNGKLYAIGGMSNGQKVEEYDPVTNSWATKAALPTPRVYPGVVAALNGKVYVIGGADILGGLAPSGKVEEYDPATDSWATKTSMPTPRFALGVALGTNGKLYAVGGTTGTGNSLATVEEYDPTSNSWTAKAALPTARFTLGVAGAANGKLYAMGGTPDSFSSVLNTVEEYNPTTNSWVTGPALPTARAQLGVATADNGKIYAIGGCCDLTTGAILATVEQFDLGIVPPPTPTRTITPTATSTTVPIGVWTGRAEMPTRRALLGVAAANGKIYAIGGTQDQSNGLTTVEEYDPTSNSWTNCAAVSTTGCAPMPTARFALGVVAASNGKVYAIGGMVSNAVEEYDPATNTWTTKAPMPTPRAYLGVTAASNGKLYAIGGGEILGGLLPSTKVEEYDPATDSWTTKAPMSTARFGLGVAEGSNDKLYAMGGSIGSGAMLATVEEYDPSNNTWAVRAAMPTARTVVGVAGAANGKLYAIGGYDVGGSSSAPSVFATVEEFNPATNSWVTAPAMPTARGGLGVATAHNGKLYAIGGCCSLSTGAILATVEQFDLGIVPPPTPTRTITPTATNTPVPVGVWTGRAAMVQGRADLGVAAVNGKVYAIGGTRDHATGLTTVEEYDPASNSWTNCAAVSASGCAPMPSARFALGVAAATNGKLYAIGGMSNGQKVEEYDPVTNSWATKAALPTPRVYPGVVAALNGKVYVIGGADILGGLAPSGKVEEYDPATDSWATKTSMPTPRFALGVALGTNGKLYAVGGTTGTGNSLATVEEYDPMSNSWTAKAALPTARFTLGVAGAANGKLYAMGGTPDSFTVLNTVEEYDPTSNSWVARSALPTARAQLGVTAADNGKIYALGGCCDLTTGAILATVEQFDLGIVPPPTPTRTITPTATATNTPTITPTATSTPTSTPSATPLASADLAVSLTDAPDPVAVDGILTYTVAVRNHGPAAASAVVLTDTLPAGVSFLAATASQGSCSGTNALTCALGSLGNGASATVTINVRPTTAGPLANTVAVAATEADPVPANNTVTAGTTVLTPRDLSRLTVAVQGQGRVTSSPSGIDCSPTCAANYGPGAKVSLNATASSGWKFDHWERACQGEGNPCSLTLGSDLQVKAVFTRLP